MTEYKMMYISKDGEKQLVCPHCGGTFLHQNETEIFDRDEDESKGLHVTTWRNDRIIIRKNLDGNPSKRRDGLRIHFFCEHCNKLSVMDIWQHKGSTYIKFYEKR